MAIKVYDKEGNLESTISQERTFGDETHVPQFTVNNEGQVIKTEEIEIKVKLKAITLISGDIDGVNTVFVWSAPPQIINSNTRILTEDNGFTLSGNTTTLSVAPYTGEILSALG